MTNIITPKIRFISDVHGHYNEYLLLAKSSPDDLSIQLGDLGFDYTCLNELNPNNHKCLGGNHDAYDKMHTDHWLGDYGVYKSVVGNIFFIRGGYSVDVDYRTPYRSWWPEEQLTYSQLMAAITLFEEYKSEIVISHEGPSSIVKKVFPPYYWNGREVGPSMTSQALNVMLEVHKPKIWLFGHYHQRVNEVIEGTRFICLEELGTLDLE